MEVRDMQLGWSHTLQLLHCSAERRNKRSHFKQMRGRGSASGSSSLGSISFGVSSFPSSSSFSGSTARGPKARMPCLIAKPYVAEGSWKIPRGSIRGGGQLGGGGVVTDPAVAKAPFSSAENLKD